jgi:DNA-binding CsgD family transcriptional regulator
MTTIIEKAAFTKRQLEIVKLHPKGKSKDEIAVAIGITRHTLESTLNEMHRKFLSALAMEV